MISWTCTVKTPSNFLQRIEVDAYTREDAVAAVEHSTGGKCIMASPHYDTSSDNDSDYESHSSPSIDGVGLIVLVGIVFIIAAWKYILIFGAISLAIWFLIKMTRES